MNLEIGSYEAKTKLPELLRGVQAGKRYTITLRGEPIADLAYYIQAPYGSTYSGHTDENGLCERVTTFHIEELTVWFGEDAEQKRQGA